MPHIAPQTAGVTTPPTPYYSDESITIYHGDSLEVMSTLAAGSIDLIVTDPPYVIGAVSAGTLGSKAGGWQDMMNSAPWFSSWYRQAANLLRHSGAMWSFCNWRSLPVVMRAATDANLPITSMMVWDKEWIGPGGSQGLRPAYELCALFAKPDFAIPDRGVPDVWRHKTGGHKPNGHPAEKPVDLMRRIIRVSGNAKLVLDPFMGSGTTVVAAQAEGVRAIGIEAEEKWCELAAKRLGQTALFEPAPPTDLTVHDVGCAVRKGHTVCTCGGFCPTCDRPNGHCEHLVGGVV